MAAWGNRAAWCVLDIHCGNGAGFPDLWARWQQDAQRPALLHYVVIVPACADLTSLRLPLPGQLPPASVAADAITPGAWTQPGFHRLELAAGRVLVTVCVGPLQAMLREQQFIADTVVVDSDPPPPDLHAWDAWTIKSLARLCRRGTTVQLGPTAGGLMRGLQQAGFVPDTDSGGAPLSATYNPHWEPGTSRQVWRRTPSPVSECLVLGAGLAGATVAAALARRGWQVRVFDAGQQPCAGASGLPAGLLVPQVSRDDAARSRLSRAGVQLTLQWCRALLHEGDDWAPSGVRQRLWDAAPDASRWHADAGWVKPARLVAACLSASGVRFVGAAPIHQLRHGPSGWAALDAAGKVLDQAPHLVLATAGDTRRLLQTAVGADGQPLPAQVVLRDMPLVHGQVSWGHREPADAHHFPPTPVNGLGHLLPAVPLDGAVAWFLGASYEPASAPCLTEDGAHSENRQRLARLLPQAEQALAGRFDARQVRSWRGTRCTTRDRLPGVGPLQPDGEPHLWMSAGMGSRGLSYAVLCAELLAARIGGEPLPVEGSLARMLAATRPGLSHHL